MRKQVKLSALKDGACGALAGQREPNWAAISISVFPVVRMSVQMHYCEDETLIPLNTVDNAVRETVYKTAPDVFFYDRPFLPCFGLKISDPA